ncbi:Aminophospholipid translocase, partial [Blumeria graminis f. sp. tritici 96224]
MADETGIHSDQPSRISMNNNESLDTNSSKTQFTSVPDQEIPRVRFSQDIDDGDLPTTHRRRTRNSGLKITTGDPPATGLPQNSQASQPDTQKSPSSPGLTPPRNRHRGYSLRRLLFNQGINNLLTHTPPNHRTEGEILQKSVRNITGSEVEYLKQSNAKKGAYSKHKVTDSKALLVPISDEGSMGIQLDSKRKDGRHRPSHVEIVPKDNVWKIFRQNKEKLILKARGWKGSFQKLLCGPINLPPSPNGRLIELNMSRQNAPIDERTGREYVGNIIKSSRYTLWNFVPRQLFFQFSKLANAYFLLISILQMIPGLSTTGTYTTIIPLLFFVAISIGKEGYDDFRRSKLDQVENRREVLVLNIPNPITRYVEEDFIWRPKWLSSLRKSSSQSLASKNQDNTSSGENLYWEMRKWEELKVGDIVKLLRNDHVPADIVLLHADGPNGIAFIETMALDGETNLKSKQASASLAKICDTTEKIATCRAQVVVEDPNIDLYNFDGRVIIGDETIPLTITEVIFRGSIIRNTSTTIGMIMNTGEECKIRMNANKNPRIKAPEMQKITNRIVILLVLFVFLLASLCTIAYHIWSSTTEDNSFYLKGAHVNIAQIFIGFFILFNTLIPLSLYVSLEIIKVGQMFLMNDEDMYDPITDTPMVVNTTTILENLGQINYIFSDKTGTLTDNVMQFRKLSVAGYAWLHDFDLQKGKDKAEDQGATENSSSQYSKLPDATNLSKAKSNRRTDSIWRSSARPFKAQDASKYRTEELLKYMKDKPHSLFTKRARFFLLSVALCHTCMPELQQDGEIEFQAASPDELALVRASQELGWLVINRTTKSVTLNYPGSPDSSQKLTESYDILNVIEFSSKRKRMSIIVRFPDGSICLICKGADSVILPRLRNSSLAMQKRSDVVRRSSQRKSLEAEQALRRMSIQSPTANFSRTSLNLSRRKSTAQKCSSIVSSPLQPIRDELDSWLRQRELSDIEAFPYNVGVSPTASPRESMNRPSFTCEQKRAARKNQLDDLVDEAIILNEAAVFERCFQHIDDFASEGLRTLMFGVRYLDEEEYMRWKNIYLDASTSLVDRQKLIEEIGGQIEVDLDLCGATAIEDKLQQGVPETIDKLRRANIKIWMLTGDKRETAINIAYSARLCKSYSEIIILDHTKEDVEKIMIDGLYNVKEGKYAHTVIVVDGQTFTEIESNIFLADLFFNLAVLADSVICCRASPNQKASLVSKVRTKVKKSTTLAIGDGANDISMILEAHVGVGISGKEGLQAARSSDYSIAQFRFLQKLLLVHGRWNYIRTGKYILATFWKELVFYSLQAIFQNWTGFTGTSLFESTSLTVFNTLFTSLAVLTIGIFEQDLNATTLLAVPELYIQGQRDEGFNLQKYLGWMIMAILESLIIFFTMYTLFGLVISKHDNNLLALGTLCFTVSLIFINTKLLYVYQLILEMHNKTYLPLFGWYITVMGWFLWQILLSVVQKPDVRYHLYPVKDGFLHSFGANPSWWLVVVLSLTCLFVLEMSCSALRKGLWPTDTDIFQELQRDTLISRRFEDTLKAELYGGNLAEVSMGHDKGSVEGLGEGEIQALLEQPRVMGCMTKLPEHHLAPSVVSRTYSDSKADANGIEMAARKTTLRHSIDVADFMRRTSGTRRSGKL